MINSSKLSSSLRKLIKFHSHSSVHCFGGSHQHHRPPSSRNSIYSQKYILKQNAGTNQPTSQSDGIITSFAVMVHFRRISQWRLRAMYLEGDATTTVANYNFHTTLISTAYPLVPPARKPKGWALPLHWLGWLMENGGNQLFGTNCCWCSLSV